MKKKVVYIVIVILLLIATATGFFFLGRQSYKNSLRGADYPTSEKNDKWHKTYTLNETIKTNCYEICFTELYLQDTICVYRDTPDEEIHEDFFKKPTQHEKAKKDYNKWYQMSDELFYSTTTRKAPDGEIFATIEYTIKNITTEPIEYSNLEATNKFQLIYDDEYTFTDETPTEEQTNNANNNFFNKIYVQKDRKDANGNIVKDWSNTQNDFKLNPLDEPITIREYIRVSSNVLKDNKSITIKKYFRKDNVEMYTIDTEPIYIKTTISED